MNKPFFDSLHSRLFWVICASAIPVFTGLTFYVFHQREAVIGTSRHAAENLVGVAALYQRTVFNDVHEILQTISHAPIIRARDWQACNRYLADLQAALPRYSNFGVIAADGHVLCNALPVTTRFQAYLGDRPYFKNAIASSRLVVGDFQTGRITRTPTLVLALRLPGNDSASDVVIYASLNPAALNGPSMNVGSARSRFVALDRSGIVLQAIPAGSYQTGSWVDTAERPPSPGNAPGSAEIVYPDGSEWYRSYAFAGPDEDPAAITVLYEMPMDELLAEARSTFVAGIAATLLLMALALAAGYVLTQIAVVRNVRALADAVKRLAHGDFSARVANKLSGKEFLEIGRQFDVMANETQEHQRALNMVADRHSGQNRILRSVAQNHPLAQTLKMLVEFIEGQIHSAVGSIVILDAAGKRIAQCVSPQLPESFAGALVGIEIGPAVGSCGAAMHERRTILIEDVRTHPNWAAYRFAADDYGLRSCWSMPVFASSGKVLGAFAVYDKRPRLPDAEERRLLQMAAELAAVALERSIIEASLHQSEREYRLLFERNPNPMLVVGDDSGEIHAVNDKAIEHYGYQRQEFLQLAMNALHAGPRGELDAARERAGIMRARHVRKNGQLMTVETSFFPLTFGGRAAHLVMVNDLTEHEAMARNIVEREELMSLLMDATSEAICGVGIDGLCTFVNRACAELLGYDGPDDLLGKSFHDMFHYKHQDGRPMPHEACRILEALKEGRGVHADDEVLWRKDGTAMPVEYWTYPTMKGGRPVGALVTFLDISERRRQKEALEYQATHDTLTGLLNRSVLMPRIDRAITDSKAAHDCFSVMVIDLDGFKEVNDALGHESGDQLLQRVGERFKQVLGSGDVLVRLGGDEFAVIHRGGASTSADIVARRLLGMAKEPFHLNQLQIRISASIGIAEYPRHARDAGTLMRHADIAMYRAKRDGLGCALFDPAEGERVANRILLMADLRTAVSEGDFLLHFQPKIALSDRRPIGFEALVRWRHRERGMIGPDQFISMIEVSDLIHPFSNWVIDQAIAECAVWQTAFHQPSVAVNISTRNLLDSSFPDQVASALLKHELPAHLLELEITESALMADPARSLEVLARLNEIGVSISIDDFGTGYSSFSYLQKMPVQSLKIDRSFVSRMNEDSDAFAIVSAVIDLAKTIGIAVVAEGIETENVLGRLGELGCDYAQGYYIARPMASGAARAWYSNRCAS